MLAGVMLGSKAAPIWCPCSNPTLRKRRLRVKGHKRRKLAGKPFLGQNHYGVPCHLLVANLLFKIISLAVIRTVKSGHSVCLSFSLEAGMSFFS